MATDYTFSDFESTLKTRPSSNIDPSFYPEHSIYVSYAQDTIVSYDDKPYVALVDIEAIDDPSKVDKLPPNNIDQWRLLTSGGDIIVTYDVDTILQSIRTILSTIPGERVRNPIGSNLIRYLFEPINPETADSIRTECWNAINRYEPRVSIQNISVVPNEDRNYYDVQMVVIIKKLNIKTRTSIKLKSLGN